MNNSKLKAYIEEQVELMLNQKERDFSHAADLIMHKLLQSDTPIHTTKSLPTKVESYIEFQKTYTAPTQQAIYQCLLTQGPLTRQQVADRLDMRLATVCSQVSTLMYANALQVSTYTISSDTGRRQELVEAIDWNESIYQTF